MSFCDVVERMGQGEGDKEVGDRQELLHLPIAPAVSAVIPAGRTMAVAAGVIGILILFTGVTPKDLSAQRGGATGHDIVHGLPVTGEHLVAVALNICGTIFPEHVCQGRHTTPPARLRGLASGP
jgi:hypothetical protein